MCEPTTIALMITMAVLAIAAAVAQHIQRQKAANAAEKAADEKMEFERIQAMTRAREEREAAAQRDTAVAIEGKRALGEAKALGLEGNSAEAVLADAARQSARERDIIGRNFEIGNRAAGAQLRSSELNHFNALTEINNNRPSTAGLVLGVAGTVASTGLGIATLPTNPATGGSNIYGSNNAAVSTGSTNALAAGNNQFNA